MPKVKRDKVAEDIEKILGAETPTIIERIASDDMPMKSQMMSDLQDWCKRNDLNIEDTLHNIIFDFLFHKGESDKFDDHYIKKDDYEAQAKNLVNSLMPSHIADFSKEMIEQMEIPMWQHLLGIYSLAYDQGQFPSPNIDPAWTEGKQAVSTVKCPICHETYTPRYPGAFHTNLCVAKMRMGGIL